MSLTLRESVDRYVLMRRGLGYKLIGLDALLTEFVTWCEERAVTTITTETALEWAISAPGESVTWQAQRLSAVRVFARHHACLDSDTEVPSNDLLPNSPQRRQPFIYSEDQITTLMSACHSVVSPPAKANACEFLIGLLACTGMRISEACRCSIGDLGKAEVKATEVITLAIREAKAGTARTIPLHPSVAVAVTDYLSSRTRVNAADPLISVAGAPLSPDQLRNHVWPRLLAFTGIGSGAKRPPRIHDLRHTMAIRCLTQWYAQEASDIDARIAWLSTYLGHSSPGSTYWYLQSVPELVVAAGRRADSSWEVLL